MKRKRKSFPELERREREIREASKPQSPCPCCGAPGAHFVPPSFGDVGFFVCDQIKIYTDPAIPNSEVHFINRMGGSLARSSMSVRTKGAPEMLDDEDVDDYGNPKDGSSLPYCCFPDCGCDGARLCMAKSGASDRACDGNVEGMWSGKTVAQREAVFKLVGEVKK